ncbi:MAG TPA: APC family permease, partial [Acidobacteriota bacterium]|nr:APC family permease [Acidobacteriota bacterium]
FISGWCYWTNNLFYIPSVLFIFVGVTAYAGGAGAAAMAQNKHFMAASSIGTLWFITLLHIRGLGAGKWLNNLGGLSIWGTLLLLVGIAFVVFKQNHGPATPFQWSALKMSLKNYGGLAAFSLALYSLVGLELGPVMGDEIQNPQKNIRRSVLLGGSICILLYLVGTTSLLTAVPSKDVAAISGLMQAVTIAGNSLSLQALIPFVAILIGVAVMGICSAWLAGSARIPFVMGIEAYLPKALGKTHSRWNSPYVALLAQGVFSTVFVLISLYGAKVNEAYNILLSSSIIIQLIPFLYLFAGLMLLRKHLVLAVFGFVATVFGILFVFFPSSSVENVTLFELKVIGSTLFMIGLAYAFYYKSRREAARLEQV